MIKKILKFILLLVACTTEPVDIHDDNAVLHTLLNMATGTIEIKDCSDLPDTVCVWEQNRITLLNLFNMELNGNIPNEIGNLTELKQLGLKKNNLSGKIPESIGKLTKLTQLNLANNALTGSIPESIGNLKFLTNLIISNNGLSGNIPNSIGELSALHILLADSNSFSGFIPNGLCNIETLDISNNQFCNSQPYCIDSPEIIGYQDCNCSNDKSKINGYCYSITDLTVLSDFISNAHSDSINISLDIDSSNIVDPLELGIQKWQAGRLTSLDCHWEAGKCNLSGTLPINIGNLDSLEYFDIQQNNITGSIPESLADLNILKYINISDNQLYGKFPNNFCSENPNSNEIVITNNRLCPCYPSCIEVSGLQDISECLSCDDGFTLICDNLPETVSIIEGDSLCYRTNNLTVLQAFIDSSLTYLPDSLDMSMDTDSSGSVEPLELGTQYWQNENLIFLYAQNKGLSGQIPSVLDSLESLQAIWLQNNFFSGKISDSICNLTNLEWNPTGSSSLKSYINTNQLCPPYPDCIAPLVGEQDTTSCK